MREWLDKHMIAIAIVLAGAAIAYGIYEGCFILGCKIVQAMG